MTWALEVVPVRVAPCRRCRKPTRLDRMVLGHGRDCAERLGLTTVMARLPARAQDGPDLFARDDEEDCCDGWDR